MLAVFACLSIAIYNGRFFIRYCSLFAIYGRISDNYYFVLSLQFTLEVQMQFSAATADAINVYCEGNDCPVSYPEARTR